MCEKVCFSSPRPAGRFSWRTYLKLANSCPRGFGGEALEPGRGGSQEEDEGAGERRTEQGALVGTPLSRGDPHGVQGHPQGTKVICRSKHPTSRPGESPAGGAHSPPGDNLTATGGESVTSCQAWQEACPVQMWSPCLNPNLRDPTSIPPSTAPQLPRVPPASRSGIRPRK